MMVQILDSIVNLYGKTNIGNHETKKSPTRRPRIDLPHAELAEYAEPAGRNLGIASRHCEERSNPVEWYWPTLWIASSCLLAMTQSALAQSGSKFTLFSVFCVPKIIPPQPSEWPRPISRNTGLAAIQWSSFHQFPESKRSARGCW